MPYGLTEQDLTHITTLFKKHPEITEAILFGSRAKQTEKKGSDIDIALKGTIALDTLAKITYTLNEDLPLPYYVDIIDYTHISSTALKSHIDRIGIPIYTKT